jgi:hypothetical protein
LATTSSIHMNQQSKTSRGMGLIVSLGCNHEIYVKVGSN